MTVREKPDDATEAEKLAYSVPHAAAQIDVSPRTCWDLIKYKKLRSVRVGRRVLVPRAELLRFLRTGGGEVAG